MPWMVHNNFYIGITLIFFCLIICWIHFLNVCGGGKYATALWGVSIQHLTKEDWVSYRIKVPLPNTFGLCSTVSYMWCLSPCNVWKLKMWWGGLQNFIVTQQPPKVYMWMQKSQGKSVVPLLRISDSKLA